MKRSNFIINWLFISIVFFCFTGCKKYKTTKVYGKVSNLAINKGIPDALVVLTAYQVGKKELPDKAKIELQTRTDTEGNYSFSYEAYVPNNEKEAASYGIEYLTEGKEMALRTGTDGAPEDRVDLTKLFNDNLLPFSHVDNPGKENKIDINVVLNGRIYFQFYNDLVGSTVNDTLFIRNKNKFTEYLFFAIDGINTENGFLNVHPFSFTTGENTITLDIRKNGTRILRDTTFFVEPKDYHFNFHY
jgi:hypothetical protein